MKLSRKISKIAIVLLLLTAPIAWLVSTNSGLKATLSIAGLFSPVKFNYRTIKGILIKGPIEICDLDVKYEGKTLQISHFIIDWHSRNFIANNLQGITQFLPRSELLAHPQIMLTRLQGRMQQSNWVIELDGKSANANINGQLHAQYINNNWDIKYLNLDIGNNHVILEQNQFDGYNWNLKILEPQVVFIYSNGAITAVGNIKNLHTNTSINATIRAKNFTLDKYKIKNLKSDIAISRAMTKPLDINLTAASIAIDNQELKDCKLIISGTPNNHNIQANATLDSNAIVLKLRGLLSNNTWQSDALTLDINKQLLQGQASYNILKKALAVKIYADDFNYLQAQLSMNKKLNGNVKLIANNIDFLMQWMPEVTRLKGKFLANAKISGTLDKPVIIADAHLTEGTATLPTYGIKIKPFELHIEGDAKGRFTIQGEGKMRRGPGSFTINGYIEPFKENMPNTLNIIGNDVEFINNSTAHLIASNKIQITYLPYNKRIDIIGDIEIKQGHITLQKSNSQTVKTKDVVYVDRKSSRVKEKIDINPHINLRIIEGVKFTGFDLYADISGKLLITRRNNVIYADGRITIKEGTYQLPGQKLVIQKGRILYPPGTSLTNPVLDIKMHGKSSEQESIQGAGHDVELSVQGTAHKPIISESGLTGKQDRAISRALLTGTSVLAGNILQDKLKISEIGLTSNEDPNVTFFSAPIKGNSLKNKDLVVGRPLGKRFYLQYLHSISEANQKMRLKYALNDIWSIGVESGTQGGGADLSFSFER